MSLSKMTDADKVMNPVTSWQQIGRHPSPRQPGNPVSNPGSLSVHVGRLGRGLRSVRIVHLVVLKCSVASMHSTHGHYARS